MTSSPSRPIQVVIPMAGLGSRFTEGGYRLPKPLLPVHGVPMYHLVVANLLTADVASVTIIAQSSWQLADDVERLNHALPQTFSLIEIDYVTDGPADTIELTKGLIEPGLPVVTGNSDQFVDADLTPFYAQLNESTLAGSILTMIDDDPKWSYASVNPNGDVELVREKEVISTHATVGIYAFASANLMFHGFDLMRKARDSVRGEFYVAPSYNQLILEGHRVTTHDLGPISTVMYGLGIPIDYEAFLTNPVSAVAAERARRLLGDRE